MIEYHRGFETFDKTNLDSYYLYTGRGLSEPHKNYCETKNFIRGLSEPHKNYCEIKNL